MAFFVPALLTLLGGGTAWWADNKYNESKVTEWVAGEAADTTKKTTVAFAEKASELGDDAIGSALKSAGMEQDSGFGGFVKDNWGKMLGGGLGLAALFKLPESIRGFAIAATVLVGVVMVANSFTSDKLQNDFEVASNGEQPRNTLSHVPHGDPNYVAQRNNESFDFSFSNNDGPNNELA